MPAAVTEMAALERAKEIELRLLKFRRQLQWNPGFYCRLIEMIVRYSINENP